MPAFPSRAILASFALALAAACGNANGDDAGARTTSGGGLPEMAMGDPDAPVELVEYASVTCTACAQFHFDVMPTIKEDYVDTGKVRFVFREYPTPPAEVAIAGFALARCAGDDAYFDVIDSLFEAQPGILMAARQGAVRPALMAIAERHGITTEADFDACLTNREIREDIADVVMSGEELRVNSTPTLFLQGERLETTLASRTPEGLSDLIDAELVALGIETPTDETQAPADAAGEAPAGADEPTEN